MDLQKDGSAIVDGIIISAAQVRAIKSATIPPPKRTGWWSVNHETGHPETFLGESPVMRLDGYVHGVDGNYSYATNTPNVLFWGTF